LIEAPIEAMQEDSPRTVAGVLPAIQSIPLSRRPAAFKGARKPEPVATGSAESAALEPRSDVMGATVDSASTLEIQPAPSTDDLSGTVSAAPIPVTPKLADSTEKKALKRLLRTIGGTPAPESKRQKP
jgi:hypothetical protein